MSELMKIIEKAPEMAIWVLALFLFYKMAVTGSIVAALVKILSMAIDRYHKIKTEPKEITHNFEFGGLCAYTSEKDGLINVLSAIKSHVDNDKSNTRFGSSRNSWNECHTEYLRMMLENDRKRLREEEIKKG